MKNRTPIIKQLVSLPYTKGMYTFFCKTTARVFMAIMAILTTAGDVVRGSAALSLVSYIWIVNHMDKKLEGICSISSSVCDNIFCQARRKIKDCICSHCYASNQQAIQTGLREHNILNGIIFRNVLIPVCAFKTLHFMFPYLRIESFGDVANVTQARNYIRIIKAFPRMRCAIWSKNIEIWARAFELEGKPNNTTYVHSSGKVNKPDNVDVKKYWFVDHIFTVYDKKYAKENNIEINCGGRKCMECIIKKTNCYFHGGPLYVNELLK